MFYMFICFYLLYCFLIIFYFKASMYVLTLHPCVNIVSNKKKGLNNNDLNMSSRLNKRWLIPFRHLTRSLQNSAESAFMGTECLNLDSQVSSAYSAMCGMPRKVKKTYRTTTITSKSCKYYIMTSLGLLLITPPSFLNRNCYTQPA